MGIPQGLQLEQAQAVAPGEAGEILDDENVVFSCQQLGPQLAIGLPLFKGVAGAVPVYEKVQLGIGEVLVDEGGDDLLLVLNGGVVLVLLHVYRNAGVSGDFQCCTPPSLVIQSTL